MLRFVIFYRRATKEIIHLLGKEPNLWGEAKTRCGGAKPNS